MVMDMTMFICLVLVE